MIVTLFLYSFKFSYHKHVLFLCSVKMFNLENSEKINFKFK